MKKILEVENGMNMGGIENFVINILRNIDRTQYKLDFLYTLRGDFYFDKEILNSGSDIYMVSGRSLGIFKHLKELVHFFKTHNDYDVVHIHYAFSSCFTVAMIAKFYGIKTVIIHSHNTSAPHKFVHNLCKPLLSLFGDKFCACSKLAAKWMFNEPLSNVQIIHNAINEEKFIYNEISRQKIREELNLKDEFVVACTGRLATQKNHHFLFCIFQEIIKKRPNSALLIIGNGPLESDLKERANQLSLKDKIYFLGVRNDIPQILSAADVFVLPSLYEGLGIVYIEAQCSGLPCFGSSDVVPEEAKVSDLMHYIPLSSEATKWAEEILHTECPQKREKYNKCVDEYGYSMKKEIKVIEELYH